MNPVNKAKMANNNSTSKRRTIGEWVRARHPDYDASKQSVFVNDMPINADRFNLPIAPLDDLSVRPHQCDKEVE